MTKLICSFRNAPKSQWPEWEWFEPATAGCIKIGNCSLRTSGNDIGKTVVQFHQCIVYWTLCAKCLVPEFKTLMLKEAGPTNYKGREKEREWEREVNDSEGSIKTAWRPHFGVEQSADIVIRSTKHFQTFCLWFYVYLSLMLVYSICKPIVCKAN